VELIANGRVVDGGAVVYRSDSRSVRVFHHVFSTLGAVAKLLRLGVPQASRAAFCPAGVSYGALVAPVADVADSWAADPPYPNLGNCIGFTGCIGCRACLRTLFHTEFGRSCPYVGPPLLRSIARRKETEARAFAQVTAAAKGQGGRFTSIG
jgi:hypothetical protein